MTERHTHNCLVLFLCLVLSAARQPLPHQVSQSLALAISVASGDSSLLLRPPSSSRSMGYSSRLSGDLHGEREWRCGSFLACMSCMWLLVYRLRRVDRWSCGDSQRYVFWWIHVDEVTFFQLLHDLIAVDAQ